MFAHSSGIEMWSLSTLRQISFIPLSVSEIEAAYHGNFMVYTNRDLSYPLTLLDLSTKKIVWQKDIRPDISDILRLTNDGLDLISIFELSMNSFYFAIAAGFTIENPDIWVYTLSDPTLITHIPCDYSLFNQDESVLDVISIVQSLYLPSTPLLQDKLILNRGLRLDVYDIKRSTLKKAKKVFSLNTPFRKMTEKRRVRSMRENEGASWLDTSAEIEGLNVGNVHTENGMAANDYSLDLNAGENAVGIENDSHHPTQTNLNEDSTASQIPNSHQSNQTQNQPMNSNNSILSPHPHIIMDYKITPDNTSILASITNGFLVNYNIVERTTKVYKIPDGVGERQHKGVAVWWKTPKLDLMDADSDIENSAIEDIVEWVWID
ncbi:hypothetical protein BKA69DRAFT_239937 [Paraphysoderma sedebokerense]|nr:hypothetical protein BKA69DRAFT_239937 [Paraphysoderma sedebokerense]